MRKIFFAEKKHCVNHRPQRQMKRVMKSIWMEFSFKNQKVENEGEMNWLIMVRNKRTTSQTTKTILITESTLEIWPRHTHFLRSHMWDLLPWYPWSNCVSKSNSYSPIRSSSANTVLNNCKRKSKRPSLPCKAGNKQLCTSRLDKYKYK